MPNKTAVDFPRSLLIVSGISCSLSIAGGLVIIATYWRIKQIRNYVRKLLVYLTVADMISAGGYLLSTIRYAIEGYSFLHYPQQNGSSTEDGFSAHLPPAFHCHGERTDPLCRMQSCLTTFSSMASFFWTVYIAAHMHFSVVSPSSCEGRVCLARGLQLGCWLVPGSITVIAVGFGVLGGDTLHPTTTGPWCWIDAATDLEATFWMTFCGKGWEILCYLITALLYIHLKFYLHRRRNTRLHEINSQLRDEDRNFLYVWLFLYVQRVWGTIRFFLHLRNIFSSDYLPVLDPANTTMVALLYLQAAGDPAQGFSNFILFCCLEGTVRRHLVDLCRGRASNEQPDLERLVRDENSTSPLLYDESQVNSFRSERYGALGDVNQ